MSTHTVYAIDDHGYWTGASSEQPLGYLPPQTTDIGPPALTSGEYAVWNYITGTWSVTTAAPPSPPAFVPVTPTPTYQPLTPLEFILLCQSAGGMTDAQLVAANADSSLAALWIKLNHATQIEYGSPVTAAGLSALDGLNYLPNHASAVFAAWPTK